MVVAISMTDEQGPGLLNRLLAERREAHRRYNEALTELDRAIQSVPDLPAPPSSYDETLLPKINESWAMLPKGATPPRPSGWGTRIFDMIWPAIAPLFEQQMAFNAALVEHLNRNAVAHRMRMRRSNGRFPRCVTVSTHSCDSNRCWCSFFRRSRRSPTRIIARSRMR